MIFSKWYHYLKQQNAQEWVRFFNRHARLEADLREAICIVVRWGLVLQ